MHVGVVNIDHGINMADKARQSLVAKSTSPSRVTSFCGSKFFYRVKSHFSI